MSVHANWTKLVVVIAVCFGAIFLGYIGNIDSQAVVALLSASLGYVFGNSHGIAEADRQIDDLINKIRTGA